MRIVLIIKAMPRGSRFERDRIAKLFGQHKTKPIQKPTHQTQAEVLASSKPITHTQPA